MFKYALIFSICSMMNQNCIDHTQRLYFKTHYECLEAGYKTGDKIVKSLNPKEVNESKLYVTFGCLELEDHAEEHIKEKLVSNKRNHIWKAWTFT
jgi:hypothetical protein